MKYIATVILSIFLLATFRSVATPSYPEIFCYQDLNYWTGANVIEISFQNPQRIRFASIYEHVDDGRILLGKITIQKQPSDEKLLYIGHNFNIEFDIDTLDAKSKNLTHIKFKTKNKIVDDEYLCVFAAEIADMVTYQQQKIAY